MPNLPHICSTTKGIWSSASTMETMMELEMLMRPSQDLMKGGYCDIRCVHVCRLYVRIDIYTLHLNGDIELVPC